jgi:hypothetical protein
MVRPDRGLMSEGLVEARVDPVRKFLCFVHLGFIFAQQGPSQRELLALHAEITALQSTFGISYKDAAHRLFMAEVEQVKQADSGLKSFGAVRQRIDDLVAGEIWPPIRSIDKGEHDGYEIKNGKWQGKDVGHRNM